MKIQLFVCLLCCWLLLKPVASKNPINCIAVETFRSSTNVLNKIWSFGMYPAHTTCSAIAIHYGVRFDKSTFAIGGMVDASIPDLSAVTYKCDDDAASYYLCKDHLSTMLYVDKLFLPQLKRVTDDSYESVTVEKKNEVVSVDNVLGALSISIDACAVKDVKITARQDFLDRIIRIKDVMNHDAICKTYYTLTKLSLEVDNEDKLCRFRGELTDEITRVYQSPWLNGLKVFQEVAIGLLNKAVQIGLTVITAGVSEVFPDVLGIVKLVSKAVSAVSKDLTFAEYLLLTESQKTAAKLVYVVTETTIEKKPESRKSENVLKRFSAVVTSKAIEMERIWFYSSCHQINENLAWVDDIEDSLIKQVGNIKPNCKSPTADETKSVQATSTTEICFTTCQQITYKRAKGKPAPCLLTHVGLAEKISAINFLQLDMTND